MDRGLVFHVLDAGGNVLYAVMYGWDAKRAYYLYAAGHPELDKPWQGTLAPLGSFQALGPRARIRRDRSGRRKQPTARLVQNGLRR